MTPDTEEKLLDMLKEIRQRLPYSGGDARIWTPDASCTPFLLEMSRLGTASVATFSFRVPPGHRGVIASITTARAVTETKVNHRWGLVKLSNQATIAVGDIIKTTGALIDAREIFGTPPTDNPGFAPIGNQPSTRPCRIQLEEGQGYEFWYSGGATDWGVSLFGWTYPINPQR